jgi:DNA-binding CsgD family transcriptional regulator
LCSYRWMDASRGGSAEDASAVTPVGDVRLTDTQREILTALCRPCIGASRFATPASNNEIAAEVFLSVDAVKAHLRALYRKFGVDPLPHNQKRARLVEIVLDSGILDGQLEGAVGPGAAEEDVPAPAPLPGHRPGRRTVALASTGVVSVALAGLALSGVPWGDSPGGDAEGAPSKAAYVAAVNGYCGLAMKGRGPVAPTRSGRALGHLRVIETMRGRLASLTPPAGSDRGLERFQVGLARAADFTSMVAERPPRPGTRRSANLVAELTLAAGQVQAGAVGYGLGPACSAIGDVVARSARNAAGPP